VQADYIYNNKVGLMKRWFLYLIRCNEGSLYTGITTDVDRRLVEHKNDSLKGAKYLRGKSPLFLVWQAEVEDRSTALKLENRVKKLSRREKEDLINKKITIQDILKTISPDIK